MNRTLIAAEDQNRRTGYERKATTCFMASPDDALQADKAEYKNTAECSKIFEIPDGVGPVTYR